MIVRVRLPGRPKPRDPRAKLVLEWADVIFYVFCLVLLAAVLVLGVVEYGPALVGAIR